MHFALQIYYYYMQNNNNNIITTRWTDNVTYCCTAVSYTRGIVSPDLAKHCLLGCC